MDTASESTAQDSELVEAIDLVYMWRMHLPGTDLRAFVAACTELEAHFGLSQYLPDSAGKWEIEDVVPLDHVPHVVCVATASLPPVKTKSH